MKKLLSTWINSHNFKKNHNCWLELFSENVEKSPESTAVIFKNKKISYKELDDLGNWFADSIIKLVDKDNPFIGIHTKRSQLMLAAMIGTAKAGKAYLPLDPTFPEERLKYMIKDSGASLIISDLPGDTKKVIQGLENIKIINTDDCHSKDETAISWDINRKSPAYILYTSGSTGNPKGVVVSHGAFINFLQSMQVEPGCTANDTLLSITTMSFDISGLELFLPIISGGAVQIVDRNTILNPSNLIKTINESDTSILQATPALWKILCDYGFKGKPGLKILCGGDIFPHELAVRLFETGCSVWNMYGPTETTIWSSVYKLTGYPEKAPFIGMPIANTGFHILDDNMIPVEQGKPGKLWISGDGLSDGYWNKDELTDSVFRYCDAFPGVRLYNTGDWVYETENGNISFLGRKDNQIKIRGYRIEAGEIEQALVSISGIRDAVVLPRKDNSGNTILAAFLLLDLKTPEINNAEIRASLSTMVPDYMIPSVYKKMDKFPMTLNNKVDRATLPEDGFEELVTNDEISESENLLTYIKNLWAEILCHSNFNDHSNFFDVGGHSVLAVKILQKLSDKLGRDINPIVFLENPTVQTLFSALTNSDKNSIMKESMEEPNINLTSDSDDISLAIIGMSCSVPGAENIDEFWKLISEGESGISEHTREELLKEGLSEEIIDKPNYIKKSGILPSSKYFDYEFFGYSPKEAKFMDPQHRLFLQHCYKALESAGINLEDNKGRIAVFAGAGQNKYLIKNILFSSEKDDWSDFQTMIGNENDFLASRVSYKLNLKGPAVSVQTACSTSLVAVQMGYQSLLNYQSDMALCGGVSLNIPVKEGYLYTEGTILSPVGECRAFDADANGTIFGSGVGVVLLKRLPDAVRDKDPIFAVIRSAAINNDGSEKIGFTAPSISGQADVIKEALNLADIEAKQISYVETHGTGTILGDPIEIAGLRSAFGDLKNADFKCYLGSVKTNIGHLDAAAGVASVIKTALSLKNKKIPPSLNFNIPNPAMKIEETNFEVNTILRDWTPIKGRRVAGISSFGIGGTNAHIIMESYNEDVNKEVCSDSEYLICKVSAKHPEVQKQYVDDLFSELTDANITKKLNTIYTLNNHRVIYPYRGYFLVPKDGEIFDESASQLKVYAGIKAFISPKVVMLFPGQGAQYAGMASQLYRKNEVFRKHLDICIEIINRKTGWNTFKLLFNENEKINLTEYTQPLLFAVEWAIAKTLFAYGLKVDYLVGHSLGEYTAACLAGAFSIENGLQLVVDRGRIMTAAAKGCMLAVFSDYESIKGIIKDKIDIAGINSPNQVVLSGTEEAVTDIKTILDKQGITTKLLGSNSAFHSHLMESILDEFKKAAENIDYKPLNMTVISNYTGKILESGFLYDSDYWVNHLRGTIMFEKGIKALQEIDDVVFVEAGPGAVLSRLVRTIHTSTNKSIIQTLPTRGNETNDLLFFVKSVGNLWRVGCEIDLNIFNSIENPQKVHTSTYPFLKNELWIYPDKVNNISNNEDLAINKLTDNNDLDFRLKNIWAEILGYSDLSDDSNFYELGGDSLMTSILLKKINTEFLTAFKLKDILKLPYYNQQLSLIEKESLLFKDKDSIKNGNIYENDIIKLNNSNSENNIYFVVGIQIYKKLAESLTDVGKCYGVYLSEEELLLDGVIDEDNWTVERLALDYKKIIKKHFKGKQISIVGVSFGGIIAHEIAKLLQKDGIDVKLLVMLDSLLPNAKKRNLFIWLQLHFQDMFRYGVKSMSKRFLRKIKPKNEVLTDNKDILLNRRLKVYSKAVTKYINEPHDKYDGESLLIKAAETCNEKGYNIDDFYGWLQYIDERRLHTEISPGGHLDMLGGDVVEMTSEYIKKKKLNCNNVNIK